MATISSDIRQYFPGIADGTQNQSDIKTNITRIDTRIGRRVILAAGPSRTFPTWNRCGRT
jgi:hypothetical protein